MNTQQQREKLRWRYKPFPELVRLAWPIVVQLLSFSVMTLVDTLFVGRLGASALAAVGIGGVAMFSVVSLAIGTYAGAKVRVSELVGAGRAEHAGPLLGAFLRFGLGLAVLLTLFAELVAATLPLIANDQYTGHLAQGYTAVRSASIPAIIVIAAIGQYRQALGDSQTAMRATLVANVVNIPLNAWFIFGLQWGVAGAAAASVGARLAELLVLLYIQRQQGFFIRESSWRQAWVTFRFGLPAGIERWLDVAAFAALVAILARIGPVHVAAHQIVLQLLHFSFLPLIALGEALSVMVAQAVGAKERALVRTVTLHSLGLGIGFSVLAGVVFALFSNELLSVFTSDAQVLATGAQLMIAAVAVQLINAVYTVQKGTLRGVSDIRFVALVAVLCAWIFTPPLTYLLGIGLGMGAAGGWWALCAEVTAGALLLAWRLSKNPWLSTSGRAFAASDKRCLRGKEPPAIVAANG